MRLKLPKGKRIRVDTETTGVRAWLGDRPFAISLCNSRGDTAYIEFEVDPFTRKVKYGPSVVAKLKRYLEDPNKIYVFHNAKFDVRMLEQGMDIHVPLRCVEDTFIMAHVTDSLELSYKLKFLSRVYAGYPDTDEKELYELVKQLRPKVEKLLGWKIAWNEKIDKNGHVKRTSAYQADFWIPRQVALHHPELLPDPSPEGRQYALRVCETYAVGDAERTTLLDMQYSKLMDEQKVRHTYNFEMKELWPVVYEMETRGVHINRGVCQQEHDEAIQRRQESSKEIEKYTWPGFNFDSAPQMRKLLYDIVGLKVRAWTKTGLPSVAFGKRSPAEMMEEVNHPAIRLVVKAKAANKAVNSFFGKYLKYMVPDAITGKQERGDIIWAIHPSYKQCDTKTNRFACVEPNLQNVAGIGTSNAAEPIFARAPFGPRPGHVWLHIDYANMELRIFAHNSQDPVMLDVFKKGRDIHTEMCNKAWGGLNNHSGLMEIMHALGLDGSEMKSDKAVKKVWARYGIKGDPLKYNFEARMNWCRKYMKEFNGDLVEAQAALKMKFTRVKSKIVSFIKIFAGGANAAASQIRCSKKKAAQFLADYEKAAPRMRPYMKDVERAGRKKGSIRTAYGTRLSVMPGKEYKGINYVTQGSAADILKRGMVRISRYLKRHKIMAWLVMCIHDELVIEIKKTEFTRPLIVKLCELMEISDGHLGSVRMKVDPELVTDQWRYKKKIKGWDKWGEPVLERRDAKRRACTKILLSGSGSLVTSKLTRRHNARLKNHG